MDGASFVLIVSLFQIKERLRFAGVFKRHAFRPHLADHSLVEWESNHERRDNLDLFSTRRPSRRDLIIWITCVILPLFLIDWGWSRFLSQKRAREHEVWQSLAIGTIQGMLNAAREEETVQEYFAAGEKAHAARYAHFPKEAGDDEFLIPLARIVATGVLPSEEGYWELANYFGWSLDPARLSRTPGVPVKIRLGLSPAWLMWSRIKADPGEVGSVRLGVFHVPSLYHRLRFALEGSRQAGGETGAVIGFSERKWFRLPGVSPERMQKSLRQRRSAGVSDLDHGTVFSRCEWIDQTVAVYLESPAVAFTLRQSIRRSRWGLVCVGLLLTLVFSRVRTWAGRLPIPLKLIGLFIPAIGLPLFAAMNLGMVILGEVGKEGRREALAGLRSRLMEFDGEFRREEGNTVRYFRRLVRGGGKAYPHGLPAPIADVDAAFAGGLLNRLELRDWENRLRWKRVKGRPDRGLDLLMETLSAKVIGQVLPAMEKKREASLRPEKFFSSGFIESPEYGFAEVARRPNVLHFMSYGRSLFYLFWDYGSDPKDPGSVGFFCAIRTLRQMALGYLRRQLVRPRAEIILARDRLTGCWLPPRRISASLERFARGRAHSDEDRVGRVVIGGEAYLAVGMEPLRLKNFDLIGLIAEKQVGAAVHSWRVLLGWGFLISCVAGMVCSLFLADYILVPLRNLIGGMAAIKSRSAGHRIPVNTRDELGRLAMAFNLMIETIPELDAARIVQESLTPRHPPSPSGYDVFVRNSMLSSIGGDYHDCFSLPDGRLVILIGDVAGHGISAALLMAIAKTGVFFHFAEGGSEERLIEVLNDLLNDLKKQGQFMSFAFGMLNPITHEMAFSLAGHLHPIIVTHDRNLLETAFAFTLPLGIRKKIGIGRTIVPFPPGATMLLYTDGVVESLNASGKPFGFDRLHDAVRRPEALGARQAVETCWRELTRYTGGVPFGDDVTMLAVHRREESA
jgi:HAMP domain-containing protein